MPEPSDPTRPEKAAEVVRKANEDPRAVTALKRLRRLLPGDAAYGDAVSTSGSSPFSAVGRGLQQHGTGVLREAGMGALQVWQAFSERQGRGRGTQELTILFTDLVAFSKWSLKAGDTASVSLLREVGDVVDPAVRAHRGTVVKWLGDGMMAVFKTADEAVEAVWEAQDGLAGLTIDGHTPRMRAGLHTGRPRQVGRDFLGVDVTIAARIADFAGAGELLASDRSLTCLDELEVDARRKRLFRAKGVPSDVTVFAVRRPS